MGGFGSNSSPRDEFIAAARARRVATAVKIDSTLLDSLFPDQPPPKDLDDAPSDPVYSTGGRKAWYRLTRKQTLREYNSGTADDNHIRVTWANSHIRSEVNKIVGRWAREDRISGTGSGARASFYWDTSAPANPVIMSNHSRAKSVLPPSRAAMSVRQSLPPLATKAPAAFDWSISSASPDPWGTDASMMSSASSMMNSQHGSFAQIQGKSSDAFSGDLQALQPGTAEEQAILPTIAAPTAANWTVPMIPKPPSPVLDPWNSLDSQVSQDNMSKGRILDPVGDDEDDEDEWGEMITSPNEPVTIAAEPAPQADTIPAASSLLSSTDDTSVPFSPDSSTEPVHASPIVRLKRTISPTSTLFGAKSFIPLHVEQGPIGPGLLKRSNRSTSSTQAKKGSEGQSLLDSDEVRDEKAPEAASGLGGSAGAVLRKSGLLQSVPSHSVQEDDPSNTAFNASRAEAVISSTPPSEAGPSQPDVNAWADADFSFFESSVPTTAPATQKSKRNSSGLFSAFEASHEPEHVGFLGKSSHSSTPKSLTPPPLQPPSGGFHSAQQRKADEENTIAEILRGLPDLSYMLM